MENSEKHVLQLIKSIFEGIKHPFFFFFQMAEQWITWYECAEKQDYKASTVITEEHHSCDFRAQN